MKILLFGSNGQVGRALRESLAPLGNLIACDRTHVDLNNSLQLATFIRHSAPDIIVNAAAYTQVDQAENNVTAAHQVNTIAPQIMATVAADIGCRFIHYSTDYVFDGTKKIPYLETDSVNPINVYGKTKANGETMIRASGCQYLILRTSWVYSPHEKNFMRTILRLAQQQERLNIVDDQIGAPTDAALIADVTAQILHRITDNPNIQGTFHLATSGKTSWHGFACQIIEEANQQGMSLKATIDTVQAISSSQFPTTAKRPANSLLNTQSLSNHFDIQLPRWESRVAGVLSRLKKEC